MKRVHVVNDALVEFMFLSSGWDLSDYTEADLVCFTGGEDVTPSLYGEINLGSQCNWQRDSDEMELYQTCLALGKPFVGICRGGQFLNVMNGGKMIQDVNNHGLWGTHKLSLLWNNLRIPNEDYRVTSTHHQMMIKGEKGEVIGIAEEATNFKSADPDFVKPNYDTEIVWYPETKSLCFQPHPEYNQGKDDTEALFFMLLEEYFPEVHS